MNDQLLHRKIEFELSKDPESLKQSSVDKELLQWVDKSIAIRGLSNMGNTCFLNSSLQSLLYTAPVQNFPHRCNKLFCVLCMLKQQFKTGSKVPYDFLKLVPKLSRQFHIGRQEDAHELLRFLTEKLPSDMRESVFGGTLRSKVECQACKFESLTYDSIYDLSLEVAGNDLYKCFDHFFRKEMLTGANQYLCAKCKQKKPASKQFVIKKSPLIFSIHLKRFNNFGRKDTRPVKFYEKIDLSKYLIAKDDSSYELYAVIVHIGPTCRSGHYFAFVKAPNGMWFEANDSSVSRAGIQRVLNNSSAYILFYSKVSSSSKSPDNSCSVPSLLPDNRKPLPSQSQIVNELGKNRNEKQGKNACKSSGNLHLNGHSNAQKIGNCTEKVGVSNTASKNTPGQFGQYNKFGKFGIINTEELPNASKTNGFGKKLEKSDEDMAIDSNKDETNNQKSLYKNGTHLEEMKLDNPCSEPPTTIKNQTLPDNHAKNNMDTEMKETSSYSKQGNSIFGDDNKTEESKSNGHTNGEIGQNSEHRKKVPNNFLKKHTYKEDLNNPSGLNEQISIPQKRLGHCLNKATLKLRKVNKNLSLISTNNPWVEAPTTLGYVKDEYDKKLDEGKKKKFKKNKKVISRNIWDFFSQK